MKCSSKNTITHHAGVYSDCDDVRAIVTPDLSRLTAASAEACDEGVCRG